MKLGKPWDRLMAPWSEAILDITVKMVVPTCGNLEGNMVYFMVFLSNKYTM
ncbi:hypothetical protein C943_03921 [Mariniradius saccharolyticus AK6]|uniref:Uncharacterized protein n=1 Tax=Mariniradius saccharolyticus AK6 TaxID=1239962 RepID=M7XGY9_9BACT|nr:hypothetical protein C943_03921 [Mariniradius saccharolyticus AK6]